MRRLLISGIQDGLREARELAAKFMQRRPEALIEEESPSVVWSRQ